MARHPIPCVPRKVAQTHAAALGHHLAGRKQHSALAGLPVDVVDQTERQCALQEPDALRFLQLGQPISSIFIFEGAEAVSAHAFSRVMFVCCHARRQTQHDESL
jgi:hypothetical protein